MSVIVGTQNLGYDYRYSPHGITGLEYNGNQYLFIAEGGQTGDQELHVLKSTDAGATWSDLTSVTLSGIPSTCVCQNGTNVYILSADTYNGGTDDLCAAILGWVFDLTDDSIGTISTSGAPQIYKFWHGAIPTGYQDVKCVGLSLVKLSSGAMWFVFQGAPETITTNKFARLNICTFNGSAFGSPVEIPGQNGISNAFTQGGACTDASDNFHTILVTDAFSGRKYYHIGMTSGGTFGTLQIIETDVFFLHLDPPEEVSNLLNFTFSGDKIGFVGVNNSASNDGDIILYTGDGSLNPTWTTNLISASGGSAVVIDPNIGSALSTAWGIVNDTAYVFWTVSGTAPLWHIISRGGRIASRSSSDFSTWSTETDFMVASTDDESWSAAVVNVWSGPSGLGVFAGFTGEPDTPPSAALELGLFNAVPADEDVRSVSDSLVLVDSSSAVFSLPSDYSDTLSGWADSVSTHLSGLDVIILPPILPGEKYPKPQPSPNPGANCIFEFYEMLTPEDVEVLPVPKKYDQLGPMRFDKIGKIFGFRARLIVSGTTESMPYAIYGDDSEVLLHLNTPLYSGSFPVRPGFDNVYEIQLPKSINTDIFRITFGPITDAFHRYNVLVKVHISGMQGQARWLPIR